MPFPGQKTPRGPFPLLPHNPITAISPVSLHPIIPHPSVFLIILSSPAPQSPCASPCTGPIVAENKRPFPELLCRESNLLSRATKSRDPDFATWLSSASNSYSSSLMSSHSILLLPLLLLLLVPPFALSHTPHSLPDDPHAFPKYRVTFLNGLPLLNETAER